MSRIIQWLVFLVVLYLAYVFAWPWLREQLGTAGGPLATTAGEPTPEGRCVALASRANDAFGDGIGGFASPPFDTAAWMGFAGRVQGAIREARGACGCAHEACQKASQALSELDALVYRFDGVVRGSTDSFFNPAVAQERIQDLLGEARNSIR